MPWLERIATEFGSDNVHHQDIHTAIAPQDIHTAIARTGTAKFFADKTTKPCNPVTPAVSSPVKSAMHKSPGVSFNVMSNTQ
jgi:hypothetical protein